ncbi:MAG: AbrB/MazE/SpoVT family DNA-binding domain-containing protein [Halobaculum sp.]
MSTDDDREARTTRVTTKGQVTIPKSVREAYGVEEGDELVWETGENGIVVRKATRSAGRGMLGEGLPAEKREEMAQEMEEEIRRMRETEWNPE